MIKNILIVLLVVGCGAAWGIHTNKEKARRLTMAENSFSTGCYAFAQDYCPGLAEDARNKCYDLALRLCEKQAKAFRDWLER